MGIDYSDIINGIVIFLLFGLCATSIFLNLTLLSERAYLKRLVRILRISKINEATNI